MTVECIQDVVMTDDHRIAFTKGQCYQTYERADTPDSFTIRPVLCATNNFKKRHIIRYLREPRLDEFFATHFREIPSNGRRTPAHTKTSPTPNERA